MHYFDYLDSRTFDKVFFKKPSNLYSLDDDQMKKYALGATLYIPATRGDLSSIVIQNKYPEMKSLVVCLEDAIKDDEVVSSESTLINELSKIQKAIASNKLISSTIPLIFIRIRNYQHLNTFSKRLNKFRDIVSGFVLPKFDVDNGQKYMDCVSQLNKDSKKKYWFMPILESKAIIYAESRNSILESIIKILDPFSEDILNVRIGATDLCSHYGVRRSKDTTIYQIQVINQCISDVLNFFSRADSEYILSGPVWEYFPERKKGVNILSMITPSNHIGDLCNYKRPTYENEGHLNAFVQEIILDKENGFIGKTVIHPSQILLVNALYVVTHEEFLDACAILGEDSGGVFSSQYRNKMNEAKPHGLWAKKIINRANVYGVFNKGYDYISLLEGQREKIR